MKLWEKELKVKKIKKFLQNLCLDMKFDEKKKKEYDEGKNRKKRVINIKKTYISYIIKFIK